jgi:nucleotide-binding universal stress UspA family protein
MSGIVCAVRSGPGSHYTRRAGLTRALETGAPLFLLVVVPPGSYEPLHEGEQRAIRAELAWRELALARSNAAQMGSPEAQFNIQIRIGELRDTIAELVREVGADLLLLGTPRDAIDASLSREMIHELAAGLRADLAVEVEVIRPDTVGS